MSVHPMVDEFEWLHGASRVDAAPGYDPTNLQALRRDLERLNAAALQDGLIAPRDGWPEIPSAARAERVKVGWTGKDKVSSSRAGAKQAKTKTAVEAKVPGSGVTSKLAKADLTAKGKEPAAGARAKGAKVSAADKSEPAASDAPSKRALTPQADKGKVGARRLIKMLRRVAGDESPPVSGTTFTESGVVRLLAHLRTTRSRRFRFLQRLHKLLTRPVSMGMRTSAGVSVERLQLVSHQLQEIEAYGWDHFQTRRALRRGGQASTSRSDPPAPLPYVVVPPAPPREPR